MRVPRPHRLRRPAAAGAAALALLALGATGAAAAPTPASLSRALAADGVSRALTGAVAIDLATGQVVFEQNADLPLEPASTEKLTVSLAALEELGPTFRTETLVLGEGILDGDTWRGDVFLKGKGDPDLGRDDLRRLARQVRGLGIRRITGSVVGDESYFDRTRTAPGWKPSFYLNESPPLSALVVDRAVVNGTTSRQPALAAARAFDDALEAAGLEVAGRPRVGTPDDPESVAFLARVASAPLTDMVEEMNTESDNFVAETLLKLLGAHVTGTGTTAAGARVVRRVLGELEVDLDGVRIVDGSGLSRKDRLTATALASILTTARADAELARVFFDSLSIAGINGTLESRLDEAPARGRVHAKTGTTNAASALAGYVGNRYVFAIVMNGSPVPATAARAAQDRFATLLAAG